VLTVLAPAKNEHARNAGDAVGGIYNMHRRFSILTANIDVKNAAIERRISNSSEKPESGHPGLFRRTVRIPVHQRT